MRGPVKIYPPTSPENALSRLSTLDCIENNYIRYAVIVLVKGEDVFKDGSIVDDFRNMMEASNIPELKATKENIIGAIRKVNAPCWVWVDEYIDEISFSTTIKHQDFIGMVCSSRSHQMSFLLTQHTKRTCPKIEANADLIIDMLNVECRKV